MEKHKDDIFNYMVFLRVTPFLPNWFINIAAPVINVPIWPFWLGTFLGEYSFYYNIYFCHNTQSKRLKVLILQLYSCLQECCWENIVLDSLILSGTHGGSEHKSLTSIRAFAGWNPYLL